MSNNTMVSNTIKLAKELVWDTVYYGQALFVVEVDWPGNPASGGLIAAISLLGLEHMRSIYGPENCEVHCAIVPGENEGDTYLC